MGFVYIGLGIYLVNKKEYVDFCSFKGYKSKTVGNGIQFIIIILEFHYILLICVIRLLIMDELMMFCVCY